MTLPPNPIESKDGTRSGNDDYIGYATSLLELALGHYECGHLGEQEDGDATSTEHLGVEFDSSGPMVIPTYIERHADALTHGIPALRQLLRDPEVTADETKGCVVWLANNADTIGTLLWPNEALPVQRRTNRGAMVVWPRPTPLPDTQRQQHRHLLGELFRSISMLTARPQKGADEAVVHALKTVNQAMASAYLEYLKDEYRKDANPVLAWQAYAACRTAATPLPEWVLEYLDICSAGVEGLVERPPSKIGNEIAKKFHFSSDKSERGSAISKAAKQRESLRVFTFIYSKVADNTPRTKAVSDAVETFGISEPKADSIYDDTKRLIREEILVRRSVK